MLGYIECIGMGDAMQARNVCVYIKKILTLRNHNNTYVYTVNTYLLYCSWAKHTMQKCAWVNVCVLPFMCAYLFLPMLTPIDYQLLQCWLLCLCSFSFKDCTDLEYCVPGAGHLSLHQCFGLYWHTFCSNSRWRSCNYGSALLLVVIPLSVDWTSSINQSLSSQQFISQTL